MEKTKNKKSYIFMLFVGLISISLLTSGCGNKPTKDDNETEQPNAVSNEEVIGDKEVDVFKLTKTSLVYENGSSTLITSVYNTSNETQYIKSFNIVIKDDSGNVMVTLLGYIGEEIPSGDTRQITSSSDLDLSKAASIEYTINK